MCPSVRVTNPTALNMKVLILSSDIKIRRAMPCAMIYKASGLSSTEIYSRREYRSVESISVPATRIPIGMRPESIQKHIIYRVDTQYIANGRGRPICPPEIFFLYFKFRLHRDIRGQNQLRYTIPMSNRLIRIE